MDELTDAEAERLNDFLLGEQCPDGIANLEMLDGFLSAVVVGPELVLPNEWLSVALGPSQEFADAAQASDVTSLLMRMYNQIVARVGRAPADTEDTLDDADLPYLMLPPDDEDIDLDATEPAIGEAWAAGFRAGRALRDEAWDRLCDDWDGLADDLDAIDSLFTGLDEVDERDPLQLRDRFELLGSIPELLHDLYQARPSAEPVRRSQPKVGRNDPCPCGSGIKYKKCHGAN
jgi:uncharacterized protein